MRVVEIMSRRVHTLSPQQTLREVARLISKHDISGGPVVDEAGIVIGYLTRTDIVDALAEHEDAAARLVVDTMSHEVHSISPDADLQDALKIMVFEGVHHLLVREGKGEPQGILSGLDVFSALVKRP